MALFSICSITIAQIVKLLNWLFAQKAQHDHIVRLVEKMLALKSQHTHLQTTLDDKRHEVLADINTVDQQIDTAVYELYGLTEDEIKLVEVE
jgi:hypothetical protein